MDNLLNSEDLAYYIINKQTYNQNMTNANWIKLFKKLYYIYGYFYKMYNEEIFQDTFEHWNYGIYPVNTYYNLDINYDVRMSKFYNNVRNNEARNIINSNNSYNLLISNIIDVCDNYSAIELINKNKNELPYQMTKFKEKVDKELIFDYFHENDPLNLESEKILIKKNLKY